MIQRLSQQINLKWGRMYILPILVFTVSVLFGQRNLKIPEKIWFHSLDRHTDFSPAYNYFVYKDTEGFVWISSTSGLNKYDGVRFQQYNSDSNDSMALYNDNIQSTFYEDAVQNLWFSTGSSIQVYNRRDNSFKSHFKVIGEEKKIHDYYKVCFLEKDTFLWFKLDEKIYRCNVFEPERSIQFIGNSNSYDLLIDTAVDGRVRFLYEGGALIDHQLKYWELNDGDFVDSKNWKYRKVKLDGTQRLNDIYSIGNYSWVGTEKGFFFWNKQKERFKLLDKELSGPCYFTVFDDDVLLLWGAERGFQFFDKKSNEFHNVEFRDFENKIISASEVVNVYVDSENMIWISFINDGLIYANPYKSKFYSFPIFSNDFCEGDYSYTCFSIDSKGNFWYGTQTQGLFFIDQRSGIVNQFKKEADASTNRINDNWITGIQTDDQGNIWVSTRNGLFLFNLENKTFETVSDENSNSNQDFLDLKKLKDGTIIACTLESGIFKIISKEKNYSLKRLYDSKNSFINLYEDRFNNIYVCQNETGIVIFKMIEDSLVLNNVLPYKGVITGYYEYDEADVLWISSFSGLAKVNIAEGKIDTIFSKSKTFQNNSIHAMLGDDQGYLWLATPKGLYNFQIDSLELQKFYLSDGTQSEKFHMHAAIKMPDGTLRFGGDKGLTDIDPNNIVFSDHTPTIQLTDIKFNDRVTTDLICENTGVKNFSQIEKLIRPYEDNTVSFEFVGIDYSDPNTVQLSYRLEGADESWVELKKGEPGFARYTNLKEKEYKFWIKSTNADGKVFEAKPVLELIILPPFYREPWFVAAMGMLLLFGAYLYYRYRINQIKEKAELKNKALENKMAALRAQMNPHFIFNSLQTLSGLIIRKDTKSSIEYVSQFAKLMRVILENSRVGFIPLEKEIELLELYLNVESKRFKMPFHYDIKTSEALNTIKILIPSMLLQPFVENSIKHGLFHKKEAGKIDIVFNEDNGLLKCVIEDNGIGRKKAAELNNQQGRQHQSRGLEIVKDRLKTLQKSEDKEYTIQIIDLYDREKNAIGTRVEVLLPILTSE